MKKILATIALMAGIAIFAGSANADWGYRYYYQPGYSNSWYGNNWGGSYYQPQYRRWHDTSHWDYHAPQYYRHGNHYHVQPGHYHWHSDGHWH